MNGVGSNMIANVRLYGAYGDGANDDTAVIQEAINNHPVVHFPHGTYLCNGLVVPSDRILASAGGVVLRTSIANASCLVLQGSNIILRDLSFEGVAAVEWGANVDLGTGDLSNILIEGCTFTNLFLAVRVRAKTIAGRKLSNFVLSGCVFRNLSGRAIDLLASGTQPYSLDNVRIDGNHFEDIAPNSSTKDGESGSFDGAIYIGGLTGVTRFYLRNNLTYRVAPQFLAMSNSSNPRRDFVVTGNVIDQSGTQVIPNMCYTFNNVDNLIFSGNSCSYVDYEHVYLRNCRNFKISDCHFENANVGIAVIEKSAGERCRGEINNCTFLDVECPSSQNNGNKGIYIMGDMAELDINNCRFSKRSGTKTQMGIDTNYNTSIAPGPRLGLNVANCAFEQITGITIKSGSSLVFAGHARVLNCSFRNCSQAVSFTYAVGNVVAFCAFDGCDIDVRAQLDVNGLRCLYNLHLNSNPLGALGKGAYVIAAGSGKSIWHIEGCTFRNVKGLHILEAGSFLAGMRVLVWANHDIDAISTGIPPLNPAVVGAL